MKEGIKTDGRYYFLDILKIICALLIMLHHYQQCFHVRFSVVNFYGGLFICGYLVELFFMISGFLAANSIRNHPKPLLKDFIHRALRLYPMAIVTCAFYLFLFWEYTSSTGTWIFPSETHDLANIVRSFLLLPQPSGEFTLNNPTWYLAGLIQCFLFLEVCRWLGMRYPKHQSLSVYAMLVIFVISSVSLIINRPLPFLLLRGIVPFFGGILLQRFFEQERIRTLGHKIAISVLFLAVGLCLVKPELFLGHARVQQLLLIFMLYPSLLFLGVTTRRIINVDYIYIYIVYVGGIIWCISVAFSHLCDIYRVLYKNVWCSTSRSCLDDRYGYSRIRPFCYVI